MRLRDRLYQAYPQGRQCIVSFRGLLDREEILRLRSQDSPNILSNAEQAGRVSISNKSYTIWRNWLSRINLDIQPLINSLTHRGNNHGS